MAKRARNLEQLYTRRLASIRRLVKEGRCAQALRFYRKLPESVRYRDGLGPLKAALNSCARKAV